MANIAIYWDFENIHASLATLQFGKEWYRENRFEKQPKLVEIGPIMEYAASLGNININRAYANWTFFVGYGADLQTHTVDLVQLYPRGAHGKNGADIRLATDVIEDIARHPQIDTVVVVGGDSDYIAIAQRVRERGHRVVGIGVQETTNRYWISSCNEFKFYASVKAKVARPAPDEPNLTSAAVPDAIIARLITQPPPLPDAAPKGKPDRSGSALDASHALLRRAINQLVAQSGGAAVKQGMVKQMMLRLDPAFDEANIGYRTFSDFLAEANDVVQVSRGQHDNLVSLNGKAVHAHPAKALVAASKSYSGILENQAIRLPDPAMWGVGMEETFALLGGGRFLPSSSDFKESLATRLRARQAAVDAAHIKRVLNILFRCCLLQIESEPPSVRLVPHIQSSGELRTVLRQSLAKRILDNLHETPDPTELAETLFGTDPEHVVHAQALIDWHGHQ